MLKRQKVRCKKYKDKTFPRKHFGKRYNNTNRLN